MQLSIHYTNNLYTLIFFQLFLSNTNNLQRYLFTPSIRRSFLSFCVEVELWEVVTKDWLHTPDSFRSGDLPLNAVLFWCPENFLVGGCTLHILGPVDWVTQIFGDFCWRWSDIIFPDILTLSQMLQLWWVKLSNLFSTISYLVQSQGIY